MFTLKLGVLEYLGKAEKYLRSSLSPMLAEIPQDKNRH